MNCIAQKSCVSCSERLNCEQQSCAPKEELSRRSFVKLCFAAGVAISIPPLIINRIFQSPPLQRWNWHGKAIGANISIQLCHKSQKQAKAITNLCVNEISRLEAIFTLYSDNSELVRLNKNGILEYPAPELVELMSLARFYGNLTNGSFDMTLQPLWETIKKDGINSHNMETALSLVDYKQIEISPRKIFFTKPNMAVSLNGIAQGYITDKITALLKLNNIDNALVNIGEIRAIGNNENNKPWKIGLHDPRENSDNRYFKELLLQDKALSTTGGYGLLLNEEGTKHHLFNPKNGKSANHYISLSVIADTATKADALSTAFYIMKIKQIEETLTKLTDVAVIIMHNDGHIQTL